MRLFLLLPLLPLLALAKSNPNTAHGNSLTTSENDIDIVERALPAGNEAYPAIPTPVIGTKPAPVPEDDTEELEELDDEGEEGEDTEVEDSLETEEGEEGYWDTSLVDHYASPADDEAADTGDEEMDDADADSMYTDEATVDSESEPGDLDIEMEDSASEAEGAMDVDEPADVADVADVPAKIKTKAKSPSPRPAGLAASAADLPPIAEAGIPLGKIGFDGDLQDADAGPA